MCCKLYNFPTFIDNRGYLSLISHDMFSPYGFGDFFIYKVKDIVSNNSLVNSSFLLLSIDETIYIDVGKSSFSLYPLKRGLLISHEIIRSINCSCPDSKVILCLLTDSHSLNNNLDDTTNNISICLPFNPNRLFLIYNIQPKEIRGNHAHKTTEQYIISVKGSFNISIDNRISIETCNCLAGMQGRHILPNNWLTLSNFSNDAICMVFADNGYDANDYISEYGEFLKG